MFILRYKNLTTEQLEDLDNLVSTPELLECHKMLSVHLKQMIVTKLSFYKDGNMFNVKAIDKDGKAQYRNYIQPERHHGTAPRLNDIIKQIPKFKVNTLRDDDKNALYRVKNRALK